MTDLETIARRRQLISWGTDICDEIIKALEEADEPLTRRDIEFEVHTNKRTALGELKKLREEGVVERRAHPDDARKYVYELADDPDEIQHSVTCSNCEKETYAWEKYCHCCGHNRWSGGGPSA